MCEIIPNLFIGNWREAVDTSGQMYVLTVAHDSPFIGHEHFKLVDGPGNTDEDIRSAIQAGLAAYNLGKQVMIHCHGGRSRSGTVVVAVVALATGRNLCEAYDTVKDKYEKLRIHPYLAKFLVEYIENERSKK